MKYSIISLISSVLLVSGQGTTTKAPIPVSITPAPSAPKATPKASGPEPLTSYVYSAISDIPYQVNPYATGRGPQSGYNICNTTTSGPTSQCQTLYVNTIKDFCLWGSPGLNATGLIGDVEAAVVAYCSGTDTTRGTRIIPGGTFTAVQFMRTSAYIQVTGLFNQAGINLDPKDTGGELDPHGADLAGNPLGGLVWSSTLPSGNNVTLINSNSWTNFVGGNQFCFKVCDPKITSPNYCENRYDLIGCAYNMPASYRPNEFSSCEGELQDVVGTYVSAGKTLTWSQPDVLAPGSVLPWTPVIPASSKCVLYQSTDLYAAAPTTSTSASITSASVTAAGAKVTSAGAATGSTGAATSAGAKSTSASTNSASSLMIGSSLLGLVTFAFVALL